MMSPFRVVTLLPSTNDSESVGIIRSRLVSVFNQLPNQHTIGIISGPTRSGKTTVALQWVLENQTPCQYISAKSFDGIPVSWIHPPTQLGESISDLLGASSQVRQDITEKTQTKELNEFLRAITLSNERIIIDGFSPADQDAMVQLLDNHAATIRANLTAPSLFILGSSKPVALDFFRKLGTIRQLDTRDLNFTRDEVRLLAQSGKVSFASAAALSEAYELTGGWIAGLEVILQEGHESQLDQLLSNDLLSLISHESRQFLLASIHLPHITRSLWNWVARELDVPLPEIAHLLSIVPQSPVSCMGDTVSIAPIVKSSLSRIETLEVDNQFRERFLIAAAAYYLENDNLEFAIEVGRLPGMQTEVARLIVSILERMEAERRWHDAYELVVLLPDQIALADDELLFYQLLLTYLFNDFSRLFLKVLLAIDRWESTESNLLRARSHVLQAILSLGAADHEQALKSATLGLDLLPSDAHIERVFATSIGLRASCEAGELPNLQHWIREYHASTALLPPSRRSVEGILAPLTLGLLAELGSLEEISERCQTKIDILTETDPSETTGYHALKALIHIEKMELEDARLALESAQNTSKLPANESNIRFVRSMIDVASGNLEQAMRSLIQLEACASPTRSLRRAACLQRAQIHLRQDKVAAASFDLQFLPATIDSGETVFGSDHILIVESLVLLRQGNLDAALQRAEKVTEFALERSYLRLATNGLATMAYIQHHAGDRVARNNLVQRAIDVAEDKGFQRAFFVLGEDVRQLRFVPAHIGLVSVGPEGNTASSKDPLSPREMEVLTWAAEGKTNQQIAQSLFLSISTVKSHMANINIKLRVKNRIDAVNRARIEGLI